jgi:ribosomal protein S18 acetylase RimI-like enzyme
MNSELEIRPATSADASFAALLIHLSMDSLADHLFAQKAETVDAMISKLFVRNAGRFGYKDAFIAELEEKSVGLLIAARGADVNRLNLETIPHLIAVLGLIKAIGFVWRAVTLPGGREAYDDELYIANLGILPSMQGRSLGSGLLVYAEELARKYSLMKCSLIVGWHNTDARRLYERVGYQIVETVQDEIEHRGYYRMLKAL